MSLPSTRDRLPSQPASPPPPGTTRFPLWLTLLLGGLIAVGPFSTDLYLPAFPAIERDLHCAPGSVQITLSAWFVGLAIGQLSQGPLSDRFGRRAPLLAGTALYTLASIGCATASSLTALSIFRVLAAIGGSASMVIPRAMVRDIASGPAAARAMSRLTLVMGVVPIAAPALGGALLAFGSWRDLFWITVLYGALSLFAAWRLLPDTMPPSMRAGLAPMDMLERFVRILADRAFVTNALAGGFGGFVMFTYLAAGPMVFETLLGLSPRDYGIAFGLNAMGYIAATQANAALVHRLGLRRLLYLGTSLCLAGALGLALLAALCDHHPPVIPVMGLCFVCIGSLGFVFSNAAAAALVPHPHQAGSASALMGTIQYALGAVAGALMSALSLHPALWPLAAMLCAGAFAMIASVRAAPV
jgi:MFS transporter, DHA1 family, multidrug resistance protein